MTYEGNWWRMWWVAPSGMTCVLMPGQKARLRGQYIESRYDGFNGTSGSADMSFPVALYPTERSLPAHRTEIPLFPEI